MLSTRSVIPGGEGNEWGIGVGKAAGSLAFPFQGVFTPDFLFVHSVVMVVILL